MYAYSHITSWQDSHENQGRCTIRLQIDGGQCDAAWTGRYGYDLEVMFEEVDLPAQMKGVCPLCHCHGRVLSVLVSYDPPSWCE